jgi:hypothetical protein
MRFFVDGVIGKKNNWSKKTRNKKRKTKGTKKSMENYFKKNKEIKKNWFL